VVEAGALDGLDAAGIQALAPRDGELPLVTRLRDGREVLVAEERVVPALQGAVDRAVAAGAGLVVVLCTGEFPALTAPVPLVFPDRLLIGTVNALLPQGVLGVLMPAEGQLAWMRGRWTTARRAFVGRSVSPYTGAAALAGAARELSEAGADLIVLDCMGFDRRMKRVVAEAAVRPVIQANRLVGRIVEELVGA
jgi:protein AroM